MPCPRDSKAKHPMTATRQPAPDEPLHNSTRDMDALISTASLADSIEDIQVDESMASDAPLPALQLFLQVTVESWILSGFTNTVCRVANNLDQFIQNTINLSSHVE